MQFTEVSIKAMREGRKTQTRRPILPGNEYAIVGLDAIETVAVNGRTKWKVGKSYAVQPGRNEAAIGRITITAIRRLNVADISADDARAEGFESPEAFWESWRGFYGDKYPECFALTFTYSG